MGTLVVAPGASNVAVHTALKPDSADTPLKHRIAYEIDAPLSFHYTPYAVQVTAVTSDAATFKFISTNTGKLINNTEYTIKRGDLGTVHAALPSTLPTAADLAAGRNVSLLFLNRTLLTGTMATDADATEAEGKWPKTSESAALSETLLRELLKDSTIWDLLTTDQRSRAKGLGLDAGVM